MIFKKIYTLKPIDINIRKYLVDWNKYPSKEQKRLQDFLYPYWKNKVILSEFRIPGSLFRIDLLNISDRIAIEYSPESTHFEHNPFFHGDARASNYLKRIKVDMHKIRWATQNDIQTIEIIKEDLDFLSRSFFLKKFNVVL